MYSLVCSVTAGKLHSQFGLLCTSLGSFEEAIQNFEKALPLVRSGERSVNSVQVEAALLQNIGAAYNELGKYFDAVIYHREAASLHGKIIVHDSMYAFAIQSPPIANLMCIVVYSSYHTKYN